MKAAKGNASPKEVDEKVNINLKTKQT